MKRTTWWVSKEFPVKSCQGLAWLQGPVYENNTEGLSSVIKFLGAWAYIGLQKR